jgi:hypothetical protein
MLAMPSSSRNCTQLKPTICFFVSDTPTPSHARRSTSTIIIPSHLRRKFEDSLFNHLRVHLRMNTTACRSCKGWRVHKDAHEFDANKARANEGEPSATEVQAALALSHRQSIHHLRCTQEHVSNHKTISPQAIQTVNRDSH